MTLKQGVQNLLKHYLPEVREVIGNLDEKIYKKKNEVLNTIEKNNLGSLARVF